LNCVQPDTNKCKITNWEERQKTELTARSALRGRRCALDGRAIGGGGGEGGGEGREGGGGEDEEAEEEEEEEERGQRRYQCFCTVVGIRL
jgi:hypothetical protein